MMRTDESADLCGLENRRCVLDPTKNPSAQAFTDLLNRTLNNPARAGQGSLVKGTAGYHHVAGPGVKFTDLKNSFST